ncbi:hypothetical protein A3860_00255 [Niastella vici]|uniref:Lipoprotein n=1 Tax=Niastella vici TaxID=1703345 RepID=A0A1V9G8D3_9BACT|nr:hypothetical protein [Niastella vici]OQP66837.1 hypothetical protein A3860_00255 [Niastella vici]
MKIAFRLFLFVNFLFWLSACIRTDKSSRNSNGTNNTADSGTANQVTDSVITTRVVQTTLQDCKKLDGSIFRFKEREDLSDLPENAKIPDSVHYTVIFRCENDSLKAVMFGPDPEGEHGLFYFKEDLDSVYTNNGFISFSLVEHELYLKPYTLNNYNKGIKYEVRGGSNERQLFRGKLAGDSIVFTCNSDPGGMCYSDTMVFRKINSIK